VSSGKFVESNLTAAEFQISYGLANGLLLTLIQGTVMSFVPLMIYSGTLKFAQSNLVQVDKRESTLRLVKFFFFPLALSVLLYLTIIAGVDFTHDLAVLLSNGKINLWSF
jgi:hypothetical protein